VKLSGRYLGRDTIAFQTRYCGADGELDGELREAIGRWMALTALVGVRDALPASWGEEAGNTKDETGRVGPNASFNYLSSR
jgi:hypothetical protein